jgi:hypothetical protein
MLWLSILQNCIITHSSGRYFTEIRGKRIFISMDQGEQKLTEERR